MASARRIYTGFGHHFRAALAGRYEGIALREAGRTSASASRLADTYRRFAEMHVPSQLEAVRAELRLLGKRPPRASRRGAASRLTPREHQVAVLAGDGLTDAEIARRLWVSRRTVTTHMHNVFRKLGLESRAELAAIAERTIAVDLPNR
jgi:DNA-binding CsgD family transcriptional regulator